MERVWLNCKHCMTSPPPTLKRKPRNLQLMFSVRFLLTRRRIVDFLKSTLLNVIVSLAGRIDHHPFKMTLRWEPKAGQAFTSGSVAYKIEDGALQVNESGLYHVYSRVELIFNNCQPTSSFDHVVFVRRAGQSELLTLMQAHRSGFCVQKPNSPWTAENYLGGGLQLMKFDRVYVNVSHPTYLSHSHYGNFFGLYKI
uniref:Fas ligand (TNF superfamily, member 6) n=1 Tax=Poecilia reticulata TaxID=8081 RepID=A0A3P9N030_POERE